MNVLLVNATKRKESTYHIARILVENLPGEQEVREVFLPDAMPAFCVGCGNCFMKGEERCPHFPYTKAFLNSLEWAQILIFATPVYVYHTTGQMKTLLDHYGFMWMVHRPNALMLKKQAVVISTAAGGGMRSTNKDITDSLFYWGVARVFTYGKAVGAIKWEQVKEKKRRGIQKDMKRLAAKILPGQDKVTPCARVRLLYTVMRFVQKRGGLNETDHTYWKEKGWLDKNRPF